MIFLRTVHEGPLGTTIAVRGRYISFDVDAATLGIRNYTFLPTDNVGDMTGGSPLVAWAAKNPDLRGGTLTSGLDVNLDAEVLEIGRTGPFGSMKIQAKDCAQGGVFQMEPEAADGQPTVVTHILGAQAFYFDNPLFRARIGQVLNGVTVAARVNIASDAHPLFVSRDSAQVATRLNGGCTNAFGNHCGGISRWSIAAGGRMGFVTGEDAVEVAPPPTDCVQDCQAQNQVRGRFVVLGFPSPVPTSSRLTPRGAGAVESVPQPFVPDPGGPVTVPGGDAGLGAVAGNAVRVSRLSVARVTRARVKSRGLRVSMRLSARATVRIAVFRAKNRKASGKALATTTRTLAKGARTVKLRGRTVRALKRGGYVVSVRAGASTATLGTAATKRFRVR